MKNVARFPPVSFSLGWKNMEILFPVIVVIAIVELIVSGTWQHFYFTTGIPLFKKSAILSGPPELSAGLLNERYSGGLWAPLRFRQMSPHEVAFREAFLCFRLMNYTPVMHGLVRYDESMNELQVIGLANWFAPLFIVFFIAFAWSFSGSGGEIALMFTVFPIGLFALLYFIQFKRFNGVFKALSSQNT
jgi:hypothetical protein